MAAAWCWRSCRRARRAGGSSTMTRKSDLLRPKWPECNLHAAEWNIPAERMKMGQAHGVVLSRQAVESLRRVHEMTGHGESRRSGPRPAATTRSRPNRAGHWQSPRQNAPSFSALRRSVARLMPMASLQGNGSHGGMLRFAASHAVAPQAE